MRLEDLRQSGVSCHVGPRLCINSQRHAQRQQNPQRLTAHTGAATALGPTGWVSVPASVCGRRKRTKLIVETSEAESTLVDVGAMRASF